MPGHESFQNLIDRMPPDRRARSDLRVQELRWRRHPLWGPITRSDWFAMLYGVVSGLAFWFYESPDSLILASIYAFAGLFFMLMLVGLTKVFLIWEYMQIPVVFVRAARISLAGFLALAMVAAAANG